MVPIKREVAATPGQRRFAKSDWSGKFDAQVTESRTPLGWIRHLKVKRHDGGEGNQAANVAVKAKGTIFAVVYRRIVPRLGHAQAIGAITHRLCRLIWKILHERVRYEERGPAVSEEANKVRARKMIRELRTLGYHVERLPAPSSSPA